ncbi:terpene synthase family protein [Streptomyces sp. NPDC004647]|uniref:terpene synthase family protein n=1 Tax=Streptomyces sp. NPDC004647 TaxID=3154671 RepID=UPI0033B7773C
MPAAAARAEDYSGTALTDAVPDLMGIRQAVNAVLAEPLAAKRRSARPPLQKLINTLDGFLFTGGKRIRRCRSVRPRPRPLPRGGRRGLASTRLRSLYEDIMTEFFLPELPRLLPVAYHPKAAQIEFRSNGWVRRRLDSCFANEQDLLSFLRQRNGLYGPLTVPGADEQRALDVADWYQYVTVIDSSVSDRSALGADEADARAVFTGIMADFHGGGDGNEELPYGLAGKDLWRRISPGLTPAQIQRFAETLEAFLRGCATEIRFKLTDRVPDYETCMTVRLDSFGCDFIRLMTEYAAGVDMTAYDALLADVHTHAMRQMITVNDLLSWRKEHAEEDKMTLVRVLIEREGLGLQQSVDRLCELVEHHERAYLAARDRLLRGPHGTRADIRTYLNGLDHVIGGSQEFEYLTPRYFGDGYVWDGSTSGWISLTAPVTRFRPRPGTDADTEGDTEPERSTGRRAPSLTRS